MNKDKFKLRVNKEYTYYINIITEEEVEVLEDAIDKYGIYRKQENKDEVSDAVKQYFGVRIKDIIGYGDTSEIGLSILNLIVEYKEVPDIKSMKGETMKAYKCFTNRQPTPTDIRDRTIPQYVHHGIVMHEDKHSSWNCLMGVLGHPKNVIIYKLKNDE
jgi:hypothetical protein